VNVEAQSRDAHSLLNWTRRLLATRKQHRVFGRGSIHFLQPSNRKILAYIRALADEPPMLCVANLSRASQAVELDLSNYAQRVPIELIGGTAFPPVGQLPYLLTLQPYAFFWLELRENEPGPNWAQPAAEQLPEFMTLVLRSGLDTLSDTRQREAHRQSIEREVLPTYLPMRRWFAGHESVPHERDVLRSARFAWGAAVPVDASSTNRPLAGATRPEVFFNEVVVTLCDADGVERIERYLLPLSIAWESATLPALPVQLALARVRRGRHVGYLTDAFTTETFARALLANLVRGATLQASDGTVCFLPEPGIAEAAKSTAPEAHLPLAPDASVQWVAPEHAYSALVIDDRVTVKLMRRVWPGTQPEAEMSRHLTRAGYANTAALIGEITHAGPVGEPATLAVLQRYVPNQGNAWNWALDYLRRTIDELAVQAEAVPAGDGEVVPMAPVAALESRTDTNEALASFLAQIGAIGTRLGELHALLAQPSDDPRFGTRPAHANDVRNWTARVREQVTQALNHVQAWQDTHATHEPAEWLLLQRDTLPTAIGASAQAGLGTTLSRLHGDFHLDEVLVSQGDVFLGNFGGDPALPVEVRRRKDSPLRDVASLLHSLDDVVEAVRQGPEHVTGPVQERRDQLLERFRAAAAEHFLQTYADAGGCPIHPELLNLFLLEDAARHLGADAASRPAWLPVPLAGLVHAARRLLSAKPEPANPAAMLTSIVPVDDRPEPTP
jgi:maltose alpha-D-glucosyltransferase/alpha-amylase